MQPQPLAKLNQSKNIQNTLVASSTIHQLFTMSNDFNLLVSISPYLTQE